MEKVQNFWNRFLLRTKKDKDTKYLDVFHFELTEKVANELLELVLIGQKRATCSSYESYKYENQRLPEVGDLNIVTNWDNIPKCVIETTKVTILPYKDITYDICKREGEDENLESWQRGHKRFFIEEGKELGYEFSEDMLVVFEDFKVLYKE